MASSYKPESLREQRLEEANKLREEARLLPAGPVRDAALNKACQIEAAAHLDQWVNSPGLQPPQKDDMTNPN